MAHVARLPHPGNAPLRTGCANAVHPRATHPSQAFDS